MCDCNTNWHSSVGSGSTHLGFWLCTAGNRILPNLWPSPFLLSNTVCRLKTPLASQDGSPTFYLNLKECRQNQCSITHTHTHTLTDWKVKRWPINSFYTVVPVLIQYKAQRRRQRPQKGLNLWTNGSLFQQEALQQDVLRLSHRVTKRTHLSICGRSPQRQCPCRKRAIYSTSI